MNDVDRVFYLIPRRRGDGENVDLFLPGDLIAQEDEEVVPSLGLGVFTFLRSPHNRGKPRYLSFPAVIGFGEDSRVVDLTLQSDYIKTMGSSNRFLLAEDATTRQFGIDASFTARKYPPLFQLAGAAAELSGYSLWALIPEDREHLEMLWLERAFYLIGHGTLDENRDVSNG
ncbi:hypothetical protein [Ralstonia solanacearum]|uniref:hypothetical protein n=1 Tax=Ralstonia solanacearum TaxID=305 RepID=UPI00078E86E0|nr:hypothetical protein [Ralstonia solanacearum]AMP36959.1 hypothetical protein LBM2029_05110 [Ralstonia solanacearum]AXV85769.1 hypothetical protein CJO78_05320 [Ralstonia solanacearum]AXW05277.1 hypothetical protein CJO82_05095 [Ralstonia solanacearum]AXW23021.1 hypothetical protein CJO86_05120 [Ralstonia solanacearum]AXW79968.1 hypothetical protein CJO98_05340 [Ralstonia solanacearum]